MSARIPAKYSSRDEAARKLAKTLGYVIGPGKLFETYREFADRINLPADGTIPTALRLKIEDYLMPPLEPEKEVWADSHYSEEE